MRSMDEGRSPHVHTPHHKATMTVCNAARRRNSECKINLSCRNSSRGNGSRPTAQRWLAGSEALRPMWHAAGQSPLRMAYCHCYGRNLHYLNWFCTRNCGAGRPHVGLCPAHLVTKFFYSSYITEGCYSGIRMMPPWQPWPFWVTCKLRRHYWNSILWP